ncbi:MAG: YdcF family protein [Actinomycetota bacterium]
MLAGSLVERGGVSRRRWLVAAALGIVGLYVVGTFVEVWLASRTEYQAGTVSADTTAAVVLGAAQYNGEPSPVLRARLDESVDLYDAGDVDLVVVTGGGQAEDVTTEAKTGYDYLREAGIPDERIRLEVQGGSTYESLAATSRFLRNEGVTDVVLVTDRYHARRATLTAEEVGLSPTVSLTPQSPPIERLVQETGGVAVGRLISFRRLDRL